MGEYRHSFSNALEHYLRQICDDQFCAIGRRRCNHDSGGIDHRGCAAERRSIIPPDPIGQNDIALIFDRARRRQ